MGALNAVEAVLADGVCLRDPFESGILSDERFGVETSLGLLMHSCCSAGEVGRPPLVSGVFVEVG